MSRLIRYDDAIERLGAHLMANAQIDWGGTASTDIEEWKELADMILNGVPTIDAVSVVRCKDCRWATETRMKSIEGDVIYLKTCPSRSEVIDDDEFCSYGERKESE